jgi:hypothetical protein
VEPESQSEGVGFVGKASSIGTALKRALGESPRDVGDVGDSLNVQRCNAFKKGGENEFLIQVAETYALHNAKWAKNEMKSSGAWYRQMYRKDKDKACRVMAEIKRMIKEGEAFSVNPAACAADLWKRFA